MVENPPIRLFVAYLTGNEQALEETIEAQWDALLKKPEHDGGIGRPDATPDDITLFFGRQFNLFSYAALSLKLGSLENILMVGEDPDTTCGMIVSILISAALYF